MLSATLLLTAIATAAGATAYLVVGLRLGRGRRYSDGGERALRFFALWWIATAINQFAGAALCFAAGLGHTSLEWQLTYGLVQRLLLSVSLVGLMHYLLYLLTGRGRIASLTLLYAFFFAFQVYVLMSGAPDGVLLTRWRTDLSFGVATPTAFGLVTFFCLVVPPVVGALGLFRLRHRVEERSRKLRVVTVSVGLIVWWIVAAVAGQPRTFDIDALQILNRVVGLTVASAILFSYHPTPWLRRHLRLDSAAAPTR